MVYYINKEENIVTISNYLLSDNLRVVTVGQTKYNITYEVPHSPPSET